MRAQRFCSVEVRPALAALAMWLCLPCHVWAQGGLTLTGVAEDERGVGLPDVRVMLVRMVTGDAHETLGDGVGRFSVPRVPPGLYVLTARAHAREPFELLVSIGPAAPAPLRITLKRSRSEESSPAESRAVGREAAEERGSPEGPSAIEPPAGTEEASGTKQVQARDDSGGPATNGTPVAETGPAEATQSPPAGQGVPPQPQPDAPALPRLWSFGVNFSNAYDSNVDHDLRNVHAYGVAYGTAVYYRSSAIRPLVRVAYNITRYSVANAAHWNRISHFFRTTLERRLNRRLYVDVNGDFVTSGTSEDREVVNQYLVRPRVEYRLPREHRLRVYAAQRLKRYAGTAVRDATNRYLGFELQRRLETGDRWLIGYRYEQNRSEGLRHRYRRLTYETEYMTVLSERDSVMLNVVYRSQRYPFRLAELDDVDVPRHNQRWVPSLAWTHRIGARVEARVEYIFETQASNDLEEPYAAHNFGFSLGYIW